MTGVANPVKGDHVIAETDMGVELGEVILDDCDKDKVNPPQPVRSIIRMATERDVQRLSEYEQREKEAFDICNEKIKMRGLDMKLIRVRYLFDNKKIIFYFYSENRVDFRELVKDLAAIFKTRIELRQIGVRDEAKLMGGVGACGRTMCCASCMPEFSPVSIKMAKDQNLALNPSSISGICGRLMCCLGHENETYKYLHSLMPSTGDGAVIEEKGIEGVIIGVNVLGQTVKILVNNDNVKEKEVVEASVKDIKVIPRKEKEENEEIKEAQDNEENHEQDE